MLVVHLGALHIGGAIMPCALPRRLFPDVAQWVYPRPIQGLARPWVLHVVGYLRLDFGLSRSSISLIAFKEVVLAVAVGTAAALGVMRTCHARSRGILLVSLHRSRSLVA